MRIVLIPAHGDVVDLEVEGDLVSLQGLVGGYVEALPNVFERTDIAALSNDQAKLNGMPVNLRATRLWRRKRMIRGSDAICGPVLLTGVDHEGETVACPVSAQTFVHEYL